MTSNRAKAPFHFESARALVVAGVVLVLAVLAAATAQSVRHEYQAEVAQILSASDRTALKLAARTTEVFDRVNQATLSSSTLPRTGRCPRWRRCAGPG